MFHTTETVGLGNLAANETKVRAKPEVRELVKKGRESEKEVFTNLDVERVQL